MSDRTDTVEGPGDAGTRGPSRGEPDHRLETEFEYAHERRARDIADSIRVESGEMPDERSGATVGREGCVVSVTIGAANTWIRLVGVAEDVAAVCDERLERG